MAEQPIQENRSTPIRGAIRTIIANSTEAIVAGGEFSVFVTIQNPFEVPLILRQISTHIPTEFVDIDQHQRDQQMAELQNGLAELQEAGRTLGVSVPAGVSTPQKRSGFGLRSIKFSLPFVDIEYAPRGHIGAAVARDIGSETITTKASFNVPFVGATEIKKTLKKDESQKQAIGKQVLRDMASYDEAINSLQSSEPVLRELQPGNSITRVFTLRTRKKVWFKPSTYRLQIEIDYEIAGVRNVDTIEHQIQVKASLTSVVLGSLFGALGGWVVKEFNSGTPDLLALLRLLVSIVLASMAVVLFARKKDVQPLIAVEDFWGGVAIGFLAAYVGPAFIENMLPGTGTEIPPSLPTPDIG